jgi:DNA-binding IclR family transcriptional regulator
LAKTGGKSASNSGTDGGPNGKYRIQVITKVFDVLSAFSIEERELTLREIVARTALNESGAFRIVTNLVELGVMQRDDATKKFRIGTRLYELGSLAVDDIRKVALPEMQRLSREYGQTLAISVLDAESIVRVEVVEAHREFQMAVRIGAREPVYCTAAGKAILAFCEPEFRADLLNRIDFKAYTPTTITDAADLEAELAEIRTKGVANDRGEFDPSAACLAVPVFERQGSIRAAVSFLAPSGAINAKERRQVERDLLAVGKVVSEGLLWFGQYPPQASPAGATANGGADD